MSEEILKAILQLLAVVAKEDEVTLDEKASVKNFLSEGLSKEDSKRYLKIFDQYVRDVPDQNQLQHIKLICDQINHAQTNRRKVVIILNLMQLIMADGTITKRENELVYKISEELNFTKSITDLIKAFVIYQERSKIISSSILVIDDGSYQLPDKCKTITLSKLNGFVFILRIAELDVYFAKFVGEEEIMLNGLPMKSNHVYIFSLGSVIKSDSNSPVFYSDIISQFRKTEDLPNLSFIAKDISYKFKNGNIGLRNINIAEDGGKLIALMGGSGAGKSTLLNVLNSNEAPSQGYVRINGVDIHRNARQIEGVIGYIPQDDLLVEELSVFENLLFAAKLCFKNKNEAELDELSSRTLESLGLVEAKNLKVGSPLDKSISGGQRKRLNIGLELLREPSVLFVDEPTSGLSSRDSENIMDLLKELSLKGKLIFVVIHQPSEDIFKMFDKLILLDVGGYQIYYGNPIEAIPYFRGIANMVDNRSSSNPEQIFNIIESKVVNEYGHFTKQRKTSPEQWNKEFLLRTELKSVEETHDIPPKILKIPGKIKQFLIFSQRDIMAKISNKQYLLVNFLEAPLLAFILAFIIRYSSGDESDYIFKENINIPVFFFMSVIVSLFMGLTVSAEEIIRDRKILKREAFLNLSRLSYLSSKTLILFSISAIQMLTYVLIGNWILEINGMTLVVWLTLFSISCFANVLGLNVSSAFKSAVTVYVLIPLLIIPQLLLSGVVVGFDKLNPLITAQDKVPLIGEVMASRWAYEAMAVSQYKDNAYQNQLYGFDKIINQSEYHTVYYIPKLESELAYINQNYQDTSGQKKELVTYKLTTVRNEFNSVLSTIGKDKFPDVDDLSPGNYNPELFEKSLSFLATLKSYFNNKAKKALKAKSAVLQSLPIDELKALRLQNENDAITMLVKNTSTGNRIIEYENRLIPKIYPIFFDKEDPSGPLDFRALFYSPTKYIFGTQVDTKYFNIGMIWMMSIFLLIALYYDWLKKLITGFESK